MIAYKKTELAIKEANYTQPQVGGYDIFGYPIFIWLDGASNMYGFGGNGLVSPNNNNPNKIIVDLPLSPDKNKREIFCYLRGLAIISDPRYYAFSFFGKLELFYMGRLMQSFPLSQSFWLDVGIPQATGYLAAITRPGISVPITGTKSAAQSMTLTLKNPQCNLVNFSTSNPMLYATGYEPASVNLSPLTMEANLDRATITLTHWDSAYGYRAFLAVKST